MASGEPMFYCAHCGVYYGANERHTCCSFTVYSVYPNPDEKIADLQRAITAQAETIKELKEDAEALAEHARFMRDAHDVGRCKTALAKHTALMQKLEAEHD